MSLFEVPRPRKSHFSRSGTSKCHFSRSQTSKISLFEVRDLEISLFDLPDLELESRRRRPPPLLLDRGICPYPPWAVGPKMRAAGPSAGLAAPSEGSHPAEGSFMAPRAARDPQMRVSRPSRTLISRSWRARDLDFKVPDPQMRVLDPL